MWNLCGKTLSCPIELSPAVLNKRCWLIHNEYRTSIGLRHLQIVTGKMNQLNKEQNRTIDLNKECFMLNLKIELQL